jgi:hypothetical protein
VESIHSKVASVVACKRIFTHVKGQPLLIKSAEDQLLLQQTGGLTDRQMLAVNKLLIRLSGYLMHSRKNTLAALTDGQLCDYTIDSVKLLVNGVMQERRVFLVKCISDVIKDRVFNLLKHKVFVPSSYHTKLNDSTVIVRLDGDKGGNTMAFKFGVTIINCLQPNFPENFDLIATMEAFDTYHNLRSAIFQHYETELHWLCETGEGVEPTLIVVTDASALLLVETFSGTLAHPSTPHTVLVDSKTIESSPHFWSSPEECGCVQKCAFCCQAGSADIIGLAFTDEQDNVVAVSKFKKAVQEDMLLSLMFKQYDLHVVLTSDIELFTLC